MIVFKNLIKLFLSCYVILCIILPCISDDDDGRIVGGVPTSIKFAPFLVQIRSKNAILCSGTLVTELFVITAAHCFRHNPQKLSVVGGATNNYNDPGTAKSGIVTFVIPKKFNNETYDMDVAVIRLKRPLIGDMIKPISLDCKKWKENDPVRLYGWGKRNETDKSVPIVLQTVEVRTIGQGWCKWKYYKRRNITENMFCATLAGKDACNGDSGGPAIVNNQFCGVVSWGVGCARDDSPGVFTNLIQLFSFVKRAMKKLA